MKVLLVDGDELLRKITVLTLQRLGGMEVQDLDNGRAAVSTAVEWKPDVVLLDVMMPGFDGRDTIKALQSDDRTAALPVIFLTAKAMRSEVEKLKSLGAAGVIIKPFEPRTLGDQIRAIIAERSSHPPGENHFGSLQ